MQCPVCAGRGEFFDGRGWRRCVDCGGRGHVQHCVACVRKPGYLWLGGDDYLECPACDGTGVAKKRRTHVIVGGLLVPAPRGGVAPVYLTAK